MRIVLAFLPLLLLTGCDFEDFGPSDRFHADFHYNFDLKPGGRLSLENFNGPVEIDGWDQDKVEITGTKYASSQDMLDMIKIETHGSPTLVDVRTVRPSVRHGNMGARYTVHVPRKTELERIVSSNGQVRVQDVEGSARLTTSNGGVRVGHVAGSVEATTSNGPVDLEAIRGSATIHTSNGRVHAENIEGACSAETSNGSIAVRLPGTATSPFKFTTSNASIDVSMDTAPKADVRARTSNGSITIHLPSSASARVQAQTSNSAVMSDFPVTASGTFGNKGHLDGTIGSGGPVLELNTSNGNIRILKGA